MSGGRRTRKKCRMTDSPSFKHSRLGKVTNRTAAQLFNLLSEHGIVKFYIYKINVENDSTEVQHMAVCTVEEEVVCVSIFAARWDE